MEMPSAKDFLPTQRMIEAAENTFVAMAFLGTVRPIVQGYQREILEKGQWHVRPNYAERCGDRVILKPEHSYLMTEEDFAEYHRQCNEARVKAGLHVENDEQCPLLIAEKLLAEAQWELVDAMVPVTNITFEKLWGGKDALEGYHKYIDLCLQLLVRYIDPKKRPEALQAATASAEPAADDDNEDRCGLRM